MSTYPEDYTPTTEEVREQYATAYRDYDREWEWEETDAIQRAEFDRWLEQYTESLREQWDWAARDGAES